jgi:hypothetical protein
MALLIAGLNCANKKWSNKIILFLLAFNFIIYCYSTYFFYRLYC